MMIRVLLAVFSLFVVSSCTTSPTTGKPIFTGVVSEQQETQIGAQQHGQILRQFGGVNDTQALNEMVAMIGARLAPHAERQNTRWTFTVLDDDLVNAFAVPGGYIYITRGLIALAQDESQVAAVLAHEMGHVNARHSAQQMSQGMLANIGIQAIGIATGSNVAAQLGSTAGDLYLKGYSRTHEFEADALSVKYLAAAGYDPFATAKFLRQLEKSTAFEARVAGKPAGQELFSYFSTHPATSERIIRAEQLASTVPIPQNPIINRAGYLKAIHGTVYGSDGSEGFVRGTQFIHPELKIRFKAPDGFTIQNTPKAVIASNKQGALMIFDMARAQGVDAGGFITNNWVPNALLAGQERITVNGLDGATAATQLSGTQGTKDARLVALDGGDGRFYRLLFLAPQGQMGNYADAFRRATYSFERDESIASIKPARIKVVTVRPGDTVQTFANRMAVDEFALERFCLLNGLSPNSKLEVGDQVKVVE